MNDYFHNLEPFIESNNRLVGKMFYTETLDHLEKVENTGNLHEKTCCFFYSDIVLKLLKGTFHLSCYVLTLSQTNPCFYVSAVQVFLKHCGKRRNCS